MFDNNIKLSVFQLLREYEVMNQYMILPRQYTSIAYSMKIKNVLLHPKGRSMIFYMHTKDYIRHLMQVLQH